MGEKSLRRGSVRNGKSPPKEGKVCEWCGKEFMRRVMVGEHFYCSGKCRAGAYQEEHARTDWLMMRVLERSYRVIQEAGLNFELVVEMGRYPGRKAMRGEWNQFEEWVKRFAVGEKEKKEQKPEQQKKKEEERQDDGHP